MKAVSLWPPWGSFIISGMKQIETRGRPTKHRGLIAIHQTRQLPPEFVEKYRKSSAIRHAAQKAGMTDIEDFPLGCVLGTVEIVDCVKMDFRRITEVSAHERRLGDFREGRFMWLLENVVKFPTPIPTKGKQGIWEWQQ